MYYNDVGNNYKYVFSLNNNIMYLFLDFVFNVFDTLLLFIRKSSSMSQRKATGTTTTRKFVQKKYYNHIKKDENRTTEYNDIKRKVWQSNRCKYRGI